MKNNRIMEMEKYITDHELCTMEELVAVFNVSMNTVRNDVKSLVSKNAVRKVYGGVASVSQSIITAFDQRSDRNIENKNKIAKEAAGFIEEGDVIFIDSGTTTMKIMDYLDYHLNITIITHNLSVINSCIPYDTIRVIGLPGVLERKTRSFHDVDTPKILERYNVDKAFLAATSITEIGRLSNTSAIECTIKSKALEISKQRYLLVDASKFNRKSLMTFGLLSDIDCLISDKGISSDAVSMCEKEVGQLIIV